MSKKAMGSRWITRGGYLGVAISGCPVARAPPLVRHFTLIQNWFEELKAKAPAGGAK